MEYVKVSEKETFENAHGVETKLLYNKDNAQAVHITLQPGEALKKHVTPTDVFFYVLEGEGEVLVGDETMLARKDTLIDSPAGIVHTWSNKSNGVFRVLVVKAPKPKEKSRIL